MVPSRRRVSVLISGSGSNLQALIDAGQQPDYPAQIVCVISNKADAYGLERARLSGVPTEVISHRDYPSREAYDEALHATLQTHDTEIVCLAGFMRILTENFVRRWTGGMLNIHPSLLPSFRGLHTHKRALEEGVTLAGCTVHFVVPELDAGPIIIQAAVPVLPDDTETALASRVLAVEHQCYPQALKWVAEGSVSLNEEGRISRRETPAEHTPPVLIYPPLGR